MQSDFIKDIFFKQQQKEQVPSNDAIAEWALQLICVLYPELSKCSYTSVDAIADVLMKLRHELKRTMDATKECFYCDHESVSMDFFDNLPELYCLLYTVIDAIHQGDPAATSQFE